MATITPTTQMINGNQVITWTGITTTTDTAAAYDLRKGLGAKRAGVTLGGTFAGGTTAVLQGSNDDSTYATLIDYAGNAISATAAKIQEFSSSAFYIKPAVSGGAGDNVDVVLVIRREF